MPLPVMGYSYRTAEIKGLALLSISAFFLRHRDDGPLLLEGFEMVFIGLPLRGQLSISSESSIPDFFASALTLSGSINLLPVIGFFHPLRIPLSKYLVTVDRVISPSSIFTTSPVVRPCFILGF